MQVVETDQLTKIYHSARRKRNIVALDQVTLAIEQGEIFGLLGPNGAGKTTLFKILLGIARPTSGGSRLAGVDSGDPQARRRVGYLPENHRFPVHLTGLGLLELTGRFFGMSESEIDHRCELLLRLVGMEKWANTKIRKFSKGMAQRIGLAQAMVPDPDILLLDEPTDGVDPIGKAEIRQMLQKLKESGKTIVLNSHLLAEVESVADRVAILSHGKIAKIGTVAELTSRKCQYEIEGEIGDVVLDLPEPLGKILFVAKNRLVVELVNEADINLVIDQLRLHHVSLRTVKPARITLEQSFLETVGVSSEGV